MGHNSQNGPWVGVNPTRATPSAGRDGTVVANAMEEQSLPLVSPHSARFEYTHTRTHSLTRLHSAQRGWRRRGKVCSAQPRATCPAHQPRGAPA